MHGQLELESLIYHRHEEALREARVRRLVKQMRRNRKPHPGRARADLVLSIVLSVLQGVRPWSSSSPSGKDAK